MLGVLHGKPLRLAAFILTGSLLCGCVSTQKRNSIDQFTQENSVPAYTGLAGVHDLIPADKVNSMPRKLAKDGIQALSEGRLSEANKYFNQALMLNPVDSHLQWLNGVAYHLRASRGESAQYNMAKEAYSLSIKFDPANWNASYQLGLLHMDTGNYQAAQNAFAEALYFHHDDADILYLLLMVSYYNFDPETAAAALNRLKLLEPNSDRTLRAAPLVLASLGETTEANQNLKLYQSEMPDLKTLDSLNRRVKDWGDFYDYYQQAGHTNNQVDSANVVNIQYAATTSLAVAQEPLDRESEMVIVDVAIIESEEDLGTSKGVNLLNGLKAQYSWDRRTVESRNAAGTDSLTRTITRQIGIPQLNYSLNIFNSAIFNNEVLARPTLIALNGEKSTFFSGKNVQAAATAASTIGGAVGHAVQINEDIGINLSITPTLREDGRVKIDVDVTRTFLETPNNAIDFEFKLQTSKTAVSASVVMNFGETLILSGLSEKESESFRDGVPFLQDIPLLQYLFSEERTVDFQRSSLVMLTPRRPFNLNAFSNDVAQANDGSDSPISQLKIRFNSWFKPAPHWVSVLQQLEHSELYREFRSSDLELQIWTDSQRFRKRFGDVIEFLYY